jgi:hypothetical protein
MTAVMGRPQEWLPSHPEVLHAIELIASGLSTRKACEQSGIPRNSLWRLLRLPGNQQLWNQYAQAREMQADAMADLLLEAAEPVQGEDNVSVQARRLKVDAMKWMTGKLHPKVYGDYAGKGPDTVHVSVETLHLTALKQLSSEPIQDAIIVPEDQP